MAGWTPELKQEFQEHINEFFDEHPELREGLSENMKEFWDSDEAEQLKEGMREAATA